MATSCVPLQQAIGKPHTLWCAFAKFYDRHGDLANARIIFEKATEVLPAGSPADPPQISTSSASVLRSTHVRSTAPKAAL